MSRLLAKLGPGVLVAATGVGAGDIAGAAFAGSRLGYAVLWAAAAGAVVKFVLNEGLARWQLATGETLLEEAVLRFGRVVQWFFLVYLLVWSWAVGSALISACGVAGHALFPVFDDPQVGKVVWGIVHSVASVALILLGGFRRFTGAMTVLLVVMFVSVLATAALGRPDWGAVARGLLVPRIPTEAGPDGGLWTLALMGGVGGTLTMLCYGYWVREQGWAGPATLRTCRIDLAVAYAVTGLFGVAMVTIGAGLDLTEGKGASLMIKLADRLGEVLGTPVRWVFLAGAWAAVFTSMLGVWQAVPYLFCDFWGLFTRGGRGQGDQRDPAEQGGDPDPVLTPAALAPARVAVDPRSAAYRGYLLALATLPAAGLWFSFVSVQKAYSLLGAVVMPMLAVALLVLNGRSKWVGREHRNRPLTVAALVAILLFFLYASYVTVTTGQEVIG